MSLFEIETEQDALIDQRDLRSAQNRISSRNGVFGAWALRISSRRAEMRELRAVERKRKSLARHERRLEVAQKLSHMTRNIVNYRF